MRVEVFGGRRKVRVGEGGLGRWRFFFVRGEFLGMG